MRPPAAALLTAATLATVLGAPPVDAGLRLRFSNDTGPDGTVWRDGTRCRVERDQGSGESESPGPGGDLLYDVILDDGDRRFYLSSADKTWWEVSEHPESLPAWETRRSAPEGFPGAKAGKLLEPSASLIEDSYAEPVAGLPTRKFVIRFRYVTEFDFPGEVVRIITSGTWFLWSSTALEEGPCVIDPGGFRTGVADVDALIEAKLAEIPGVPLQRQLALTSRIEGGVSETSIETLKVEEIETVSIPAERFEIPAGYRHQAPVFAGPGVTATGGLGERPGSPPPGPR